MKFALVSQALPPECSGQAMVIYRLVQGLRPNDYCLISREHNPASLQTAYTQKLDCQYYQLASDEVFTRGSRWGMARWRRRINALPAIILRGRQIRKIIEREKCDAVIACTGDFLDLPAAYYASWKAKVPFYAYIFDHYSYRECDDSVIRFLAKRFEPHLLRGATRIIVTNAVLGEELHEQYEVNTDVIHNSCDLTEYDEPLSEKGWTGTRIVYTGNIYEAHYDAIQNLLTAIESLQIPNLALHVYTPLTKAQLAEKGIRGAIFCHKQEPQSSMPKIQQDADLLFLPLAFDSPFPDLVKTSATGKLGEYLASGRPTLVHAPTDSFPARYLRKYECGIVVSENDSAKLAEAIKQLLADSSLRKRVSENARARARVDFDISTAQSKFLSVINGPSGFEPRADYIEA